MLFRSELLGVSTVTVNKYVKQGLEYLDTRSHRKIPKHAVHLWKNPKYSILMQMIHQEKKLRNQDPKEQLSEVMQELLDFQIQYGVDSSQQARLLVETEEMDISEYYEWEALEEELEQLKQELKGKGNSG